MITTFLIGAFIWMIVGIVVVMLCLLFAGGLPSLEFFFVLVWIWPLVLFLVCYAKYNDWKQERSQ